ncbi:MAG: hypothetical protein ABIH83_04440 [Candidatus Micrarchaeota archaeon]
MQETRLIEINNISMREKDLRGRLCGQGFASDDWRKTGLDFVKYGLGSLNSNRKIDSGIFYSKIKYPTLKGEVFSSNKTHEA